MLYSARSAIMAFTFCVGLLITVPLVTFNSMRSSRAALDVAQDLIGQSGDRVVLRTEMLMQPFSFLPTHIRQMPGVDAKACFDHPLIPTFLSVLEHYPQVYSIYIGNSNGDFIQTISLSRRPLLAEKLKGPAQARFALRCIREEIGGRKESWRFLDRNQRIMAALSPKPASYDPRTRPWFQASLKTDEPVPSPLYIFNSTQELGLTVSCRVAAKTPIIFGMDLTLASLSEFLAKEKVGPSGLLLLFDKDGALIGHSDPARLYRRSAAGDGAKTVSRADIKDLNDPVAAAVFEAFTQAGTEDTPVQRLAVKGEGYMFQVRPLKNIGMGHSFLAAVAKAEDFTAPLERTRNQTLLFALGIMLLLLPALAWIAGRFSTRMHLLAEAADRIRRLDMGAKEDFSSRIREVCTLGEALENMRQALSAFSRYLPKSLVRRLMESGVEPCLGGERRQITLLFTDVENFTTLSENMPPEELMQAMSRYFEAVGHAILASGGTIDKYIGDAVMAFWNAPFEHSEHVQQACAAALRLKKASEELNAQFAASGLPLMRTRVGLHTGQAIVGNVGAADRMDYTAMGASVNLASRMEGLNKFYNTSILVSRQVREAAKKDFLFRSVDVVVPKGAVEPTTIFELVGAMPASAFADVAAPRARLGFCSRWERAITLYRTVQWERALAEFSAMSEADPADHLAKMYVMRTKRLMENKQGKDWKAVMRFQEK